MTTMVGNDERRERATDDDGSDEEGKSGKGHGVGNEGGIAAILCAYLSVHAYR